MRQGRDRRGREASLESLCNPSDEGMRTPFFIVISRSERDDSKRKKVKIIY